MWLVANKILTITYWGIRTGRDVYWIFLRIGLDKIADKNQLYILLTKGAYLPHNCPNDFRIIYLNAYTHNQRYDILNDNCPT